MGAYFANVFWSMIFLICIIALCGLLQGLCQFCCYICPKIGKICKPVKDKFCNFYENINCSYCSMNNFQIINKYLIKNINKITVKKVTINPCPIVNNLPDTTKCIQIYTSSKIKNIHINTNI
mgnify:CR=1 FL=1|jgi:hypothetical protein